MPVSVEQFSRKHPVYFYRNGAWQSGMITARTATEEVLQIIKSEDDLVGKRVILHEDDHIPLIQPNPDLDTIYVDKRLDQ